MGPGSMDGGGGGVVGTRCCRAPSGIVRSAQAMRTTANRRRCGKPVEATWKACAPAVGVDLFFTLFGTNRCDRSFVVHLRTLLRLRIAPPSLEFSLPIRYAQEQKTVNIVRFNETINGRPYVIEVSPVGHDRWRAQIAGTPGRTTALMPFYG